MGIHTKQREMEEFQQKYIKKSSCIILVLMALLVGTFIGNTITMLYLGQNAQQVASAPAPQEDGQHEANPAALAKLEAEAAKNPTDATGWIKLGNFCFDHNLPEKAIVAYERAVELKPMQVGVWSDLGVMYRRAGQFKKALDAFEHAADLDPKHVIARFNMGIVYLHDLNDKEGARKAWMSVLAIDPGAKSPSGQLVSEMVKGLGE